MNVEELLEEWEHGGTGLRPKRLQTVRPYLMQYTGMYVPHRLSEIEAWQDGLKPQITRKLRRAAGKYGENADTAEDSGDEPPDDDAEE